MAITKLFSMRQKENRGEYPDVYVYNELPIQLRRQVIHILTDYLGDYYSGGDNLIYKAIYEKLCREYGLFELDNTNPNDYSYNKIQQFFLNARNIEQALDVIELCFISINNEYNRYNSEKALMAINELNTRFKMHGVGYEFVDNQIIRIDSELTHQEIIKPTLGFLRDEQYFSGANAEFLNAHAHYRNKQYKEAITECTKAFESCMKGICEKRGWQYEQSAPAKKLITTCLDNGLVPSYMQDHLTQLRGLLESTATPRNKESGHGQGPGIKDVPEELASYALHLTASNILFLVNCEKNLK